MVQKHHTRNISLSKACRGNNAGDGPRGIESRWQKGLDRNGIVLIGFRNRSIPNSNFAVSEIVAETLQRKFGDDFPIVNSMILEINHEIIQFYKEAVVNKMISDTDVTHIKYVNSEDDLRESEIYSVSIPVLEQHHHRLPLLPLTSQAPISYSSSTVPEGTQVRMGVESVSTGESSASSASQVVRMNSVGQSTIENIVIPRLRPTISSR